MKTIEQEATELQERYGKKNHYYGLGVYAGIKKGVELALRWIPIEENLPQKDPTGFYLPVLVLDDSSKLCSSAGYINGRFVPDNMVLSHEDITHWRPIQLS